VGFWGVNHVWRIGGVWRSEARPTALAPRQAKCIAYAGGDHAGLVIVDDADNIIGAPNFGRAGDEVGAQVTVDLVVGRSDNPRTTPPDSTGLHLVLICNAFLRFLLLTFHDHVACGQDRQQARYENRC
jgi:hypothetical protein